MTHIYETTTLSIYQSVSERSTNLRAAVFCCCEVDLGPVTLKLGRDIDILKKYLCTENKVARSSYSKVTA